MNTADFSAVSLRASRAARKLELRARIVQWWQRLRSRYELTSLDEAGLRDIGLSHSEAEFESSKPFWQG
jgi:uncharacterized protein YjiS (DUF1127 family)